MNPRWGLADELLRKSRSVRSDESKHLASANEQALFHRVQSLRMVIELLRDLLKAYLQINQGSILLRHMALQTIEMAGELM